MGRREYSVQLNTTRDNPNLNSRYLQKGALNSIVLHFSTPSELITISDPNQIESSLPMASQDSDSNNNSFYSRKEKSLAVLSTKFLKLYDRDGVDFIGLDNAAAQLGVERRRIYDIVNILESVGLLAKRGKNQYAWKGFNTIPRALEVLKKEALKENMSYPNRCNSGNVSNENQSRGSSNLNADESSKHFSSSKLENRKDKSLGLLTQNFIKLFLTSKADLITLDGAAATLLGDLHAPTAMKTKVRRLYDIANVFSSMDLIEKTRHPENGKPAFRWLGPEGHAKIIPNTTLDLINETKKRAFGTDITNTHTRRSKVSNEKVTVAMYRTNDLRRDECQENLTKQQPQHSSKDFIYVPFCPPSVSNVGLPSKTKKIQDHDWENLASTYRPQYHNPVLTDLFEHYVKAWKSLCEGMEVTVC